MSSRAGRLRASTLLPRPAPLVYEELTLHLFTNFVPQATYMRAMGSVDKSKSSELYKVESTDSKSQEVVWGCELTSEKPEVAFDFGPASDEDFDDTDVLLHTLFLRHALLGVTADISERHCVQITTKDQEHKDITIPLLTMGGPNQPTMVPLELNFSNSTPVTFKLIAGKGPLHLVAQHLIEFPEEDDWESADGDFTTTDGASEGITTGEEEEYEENAVEEEEEEEEEEVAKPKVSSSVKRKATSPLVQKKKQKVRMEKEPEEESDQDSAMEEEEEEEISITSKGKKKVAKKVGTPGSKAKPVILATKKTPITPKQATPRQRKSLVAK